MIHRKFFDSEGRQTTPDKAASCHEIETDGEGNVIAERNYLVEGNQGVRFSREGLEKLARELA